MSIYVDLAVGLALAFLVLSLIVSGIQEAFTRLLDVRSKVLWAFFADQFNDVTKNPEVPATVWRLLRLAWSRVLWKAGIADPRPTLPETREGGRRAAIEGAVQAAQTQTKPTLEQFYDRLADIDRSWLNGAKTHISTIPATRVATAFLELSSLKGSPEVGGAEEGATVGARKLEAARDQVDSWIESLAGTKLYQPLRAAWLAAERDVDAFHDRVSEWFDGEMARISGLYRRHVRWLMFFIAAFVTLFTGFDSVAYARQMLDDEAFRTQMVAVAQGNPDRLEDLATLCTALKASDDDPDAAGDAAGNDPKAEAPADSDVEDGSGTGEDGDGDGGTTSAAPYECFHALLSDPSLTRILGDSLFVVKQTDADNASIDFRGSEWSDRVFDPARFWGLALTAVALLFGAPFWWDLLRRLTGRKQVPSGK